jgi:DNA-binding NarL/FixJ family response regulator
MLETADPPFYLLVADISLEGGGVDKEGMDLIRKLREYGALTSVIIVTGYPSIRTAKDAFTQLDVFDYLEKFPGPGQQFSPDYYLERARAAVAEATERRKELSVKRVIRVLVYVRHENLSKQILDLLADSDDMQVEVAMPGANVQEIRNQLTRQSYDLVIVQINPLDESAKVRELLDLIREYNPGVELLGVGDYDKGHKLLVDTLTRFGVTGLVDSREPLDLRRKVEEATKSVGTKYITAAFEGIPPEAALQCNREYRLKVTVTDFPPQGEASVAIRLLSLQRKIIRLNSALSLPPGTMKVQPNTIQDVVVYSSGDVRPAEFSLTPTTAGRREIVLDFYREGRWLRKLRLERLVLTQPESHEIESVRS